MKILILTASAGNGHNSTAKKIKDKFMTCDSSNEVEIVDTYKEYASKIVVWGTEIGYLFVCNHMIKSYNHFFKKSEKSFDQPDKLLTNKNTYSMLKGLLDKIYDFKPDLIISTYVFSAVAVANLKRIYNIPAKVACMTLDYGVSPGWECAASGLDFMFLTDEGMVDDFIKRGFNKEQLHVVGIPVADAFASNKDKLECRKKLGLNEDFFTMTIMKSGFFSLKERQIINNLKKVKPSIQVIIVNGRSIKSKQKLDKLIAKENMHHKIINLGFTDVVDYFFASDIILGKAGGLTTTETVTCGLPSLIVNKLPQQEIYNKEYFIRNKCALPVDSKNLADTINKIIEDKGLYNALKENTLKIRKLNALDKIYDILKDVPKADYQNISCTDTKRQIISKIEKERKLSKKNAKNKKIGVGSYI